MPDWVGAVLQELLGASPACPRSWRSADCLCSVLTFALSLSLVYFGHRLYICTRLLTFLVCNAEILSPRPDEPEIVYLVRLLRIQRPPPDAVDVLHVLGRRRRKCARPLPLLSLAPTANPHCLPCLLKEQLSPRCCVRPEIACSSQLWSTSTQARSLP